MPRVTVLIPTHDHGPMLAYAVRSVQAQTVADLEVFIIGDGVPEVTRRLVADLIAADPRIRFFDHPKGPRTGEAYRAAALREATGTVVCYLCDDDLWLPDHLETMLALLGDADFAHTLPLRVNPDGTFFSRIVDFGLPDYRPLHMVSGNQVPLTSAGHTMAAYRRLPFGWQTAPAGIPTDLHMWRQFFADPACRIASSHRVTTLNFPVRDRAGWTVEERCAELDRWWRRVTAPGGREALVDGVLEAIARHRARLRLEAAAARAELDAVYGSVTWRARGRLLRTPGLGALVARAVRALGRFRGGNRVGGSRTNSSRKI